MAKDIIPDVSKTPGAIINVDKAQGVAQVQPDSKEVKAEVKPEVKEEAKAEPKTEESKNELTTPETESKEEETGSSIILKKLEEQTKIIAKLQADNTSLQESVKAKSEHLNAKHNELNLLKESKEELAKRIVKLQDKETKREKASWERINKMLASASEQVKSFVDVVKTEDMTADELLLKISEAQEKGLLGSSSGVKVDNNFGVKPVVKSGNRPTAKPLYDQKVFEKRMAGLDNLSKKPK